MRPDKFNRLTLDQRADLLNQDGVYLGVRDYYLHDIQLYGFRGLYVERWYCRAENRITRIEVVEDDEALLRYVHSIDLSNLLQ